MTSAQLPLGAADESAIRAVLSEFAHTWNRHDMKAMHDLVSEDVEWINVVGHHWRGKAAVYRGHDAIHRGMFANTDMSVASATIRFITRRVAVAVATMHFGPSTDPRWPTRPASKTRGSFTLLNLDGAWKIAHFQNTNVDPDAEDLDPVTWDENGFPPVRN